MTEPEPDVTELSTRNKESEDVTVLSERDRSRAQPDAEVPAEGVAAPADDGDDGDDVTRYSSRSSNAARHSADVDTADETRLSRRSGEAPPAPRAARTGSTLSALPPGVIGGAVAERGTFGQPGEEYEAREAPDVVVPHAHADAVRTAPAEPAPDPEHARSRREAARHRRLITAAIVVGVAAAIMTAAIIGIIALVHGGA